MENFYSKLVVMLFLFLCGSLVLHNKKKRLKIYHSCHFTTILPIGRKHYFYTYMGYINSKAMRMSCDEKIFLDGLILLKSLKTDYLVTVLPNYC